MVLAAGAPEAFLQGAVFGLNQLSELQKGAAKLSDENYSIEGQAGNGDVMTAQIASGLKPPAGLVADGVSIAPPIVENYQWLAEKQDGDFTLTGFAPSAMARGELVNALTVVQPNANIDNQLEIAGGAPEAYGAGTAYALDLLADLEPGSATLEGNRFSVSGVASSVEAYERLVGKRGSLPEGLELDAFSIEPATVEPYGFALEIAGANATLSGFAPSADLKAAAETATNGALRFSEISNGLKIAAGLPGNIDYDATMSFAADQLSKMTAGRFAVENDELSISGAARSDAEFDSIQSALADNLPAGLTIVMQEITLPVIDPYVWSAERRGDTVSLAGYGPSSQDIEGISASATSRFSGLTVKNEIQRAGGAPRGFDSAVSVALSILGRMKEGRAKLTGTELTVTGETFTQALRDTLTTRVENGLPPGFTGSAAITAPVLEPVAPNRCGPLVAARMDGAKIQFESAKSVIREESFGLLDEITGIVLRCPETRLEVNGHTDSDGRDTYNQRLSEARANAVRTYLIEGGVDALRVRARGFGETEPIADNETDEGKALNRRIEFEVIEN
jgi:OOP family OmpA-OmpF porin